MVSKKNFQQNGRPMRGGGGRGGGAMPYKKPFKPQQGPGGAIGGENNFQSMMFNASQIPDNPGYMDFSNPTPPISASGNNNNQAQGAAAQVGPKKKNNKNKQKNKPQQQQQQMPQNGNGWNMNQLQGGGFNNGGGQQRFNPNQMGGMNRGGRGGGNRMMPSFGRMGGGPMMGPPHGFQPPMMPPMMPPMGRGGPQMGGPNGPPLFMRRNGRFGAAGGGGGGPMMGPMHQMMPPMMSARMGGMTPRGGPAPFNGGGKIKKPNAKLIKKAIKGATNAGGGSVGAVGGTANPKSTIRTLKNLVNQYPIDKPWVTDAIRAEHAAKVDIENRLKGKKDDELFAQFKTQRDKFVALYEAARAEHLKTEAAAVKAKKDAKDKQTNNKTAAKDGNSKEAIPNKNDKA